MAVNLAEIIIWSSMMGALLLLMLVAAIDVLRLGNIAAWRGLSFVVLTGVSSIIMSGLPEYLLGITDERLLLPAKVTMGPLSAALTIYYLGIWFGQGFEDRFLRRLVVYGSSMTLLAAIAMGVWAATTYDDSPHTLLAISGGINVLSAVIAAAAAVRGTMLGDKLARWLLLASLFLTVLVLGLYSKGMKIDASPWVWAITALCTVGYFLVVTTVTLIRNQSIKRLNRLARGNNLTDEITGLPIGSMLLSKVDDALWRSYRLESESAIVALLRFNYELRNSRAIVQTPDGAF